MFADYKQSGGKCWSLDWLGDALMFYYVHMLSADGKATEITENSAAVWAGESERGRDSLCNYN